MECRGYWVYKHAVGGGRPTHTVQSLTHTYPGRGTQRLARRGGVPPHEGAGRCGPPSADERPRP
eukprot:11156208-Lingulodinium_polyedra.AAC.1